MGSRGYGRISFKNLEVYWNRKEDYESGNIDFDASRKINGTWDTPSKIVANFDAIKVKLK